jgi:hypothetical protein
VGVKLRTKSGRTIERILVAIVNPIEDAKPQAVTAVAVRLVGVAKEMLSTPGTGKIRRGGRTRLGRGSFNRNKDGKLVMVHRGAPRTNIDPTNRASVPGASPAPDTGQLRNSVDYELVSNSVAIVGSGLDKAAWLEFGTTRIAPRPWLRPSLAAIKDEIGPMIAEVLRRAIK